MLADLSDYYNAWGPTALGLTFDVDSAPDFVLEALADSLASYGLAATVFATHPSSALRASERIEIGIHPNFLPGSTHGGTEDAVLDTMMNWFPDAVGMRSHGLHQSSNLLRSLARRGIRYDCNLLQYDLPYLQAFDTFYGVLRIPYHWSDASHLLGGRPLTLDRLGLETPGLKVLDLHPMLWYLNASTFDGYSALKRACPSLPQATPDTVAPFVDRGPGIRTLTDALFQHVAEAGLRTFTLSDFHDSFRRHQAAIDDDPRIRPGEFQPFRFPQP